MVHFELCKALLRSMHLTRSCGRKKFVIMEQNFLIYAKSRRPPEPLKTTFLKRFRCADAHCGSPVTRRASCRSLDSKSNTHAADFASPSPRNISVYDGCLFAIFSVAVNTIATRPGSILDIDSILPYAKGTRRASYCDHMWILCVLL